MDHLEQIARAALGREALLLRELVHDFLRARPSMSLLPEPASHEPEVDATMAGLAELLAQRMSQAPPPWAAKIGALPQPFHLIEGKGGFRRTRALCESQSPEPLRKRGFYAPPNFLEFA